jgi:hypothetical protein
MSSITAWIDIALGVLIAVVYLLKLTSGRGKPEMTGPRARRNAWSLFCTGLLTIAVGMMVLGWAAKNDGIVWVARLAIFAIVGFILVLGLRSRGRGRPVGETAETHPETRE